MDLQLAGKVVVVAGAGGAIGAAIVDLFAEEGAHVIAGCTAQDHLRGRTGVVPVELDLTVPGGPARLVGRAVEDHRRVDVLVNNVGPVELRPDGFLSIDDVEFERALRLNFLLAVATSRAVLPTMAAQQQGVIINLASVAARQPVAQLVHYSAAKAALVSLTKALSQEFGPRGVRVVAVSPSPVAAPGDRPVLDLDPATGRPTRPEEVASLVVVLSSPRLANLTGTDTLIDGGVIRTT